MRIVNGRLRAFSVVAGLMILVVSCGDESTTNPSTLPPDFPLLMQSQWTYQLESGASGDPEQLTISVLDRRSRSTEVDLVLLEFQATTTQVETVEVRGDTVQILGEKEAPLRDAVFVFPLHLEAEWGGAQDPPAGYWVVQDGPIEVLAGRFDHAFQIVEKRWLGPNKYRTVLTWFVPGVGVVLREEREINTTNPGHRLELVSYRIGEESRPN